MVLILTTVLSGRMPVAYRFRYLIVLAAVGYVVAGEQRLQRFTTLQDPEFLSERLVGSVNLSFLELARQYPLGNGLGGGGTSVPYFLQNRIRNVVTMENEYARILLELGLPGLVMWAMFLIWVVHPTAHPPQRHVLLRPPARLRGVRVFVRARPHRRRSVHLGSRNHADVPADRLVRRAGGAICARHAGRHQGARFGRCAERRRQSWACRLRGNRRDRRSLPAELGHRGRWIPRYRGDGPRECGAGDASARPRCPRPSRRTRHRRSLHAAPERRLPRGSTAARRSAAC